MKFSRVWLATLLLLVYCSSVPPVAPTQSPTETVSAVPTDTPTAAAVSLQPFGTVEIAPDKIEFDVNGDGSNVDSISFWEAPEPVDSLMFVSSKGNEFSEVYRYPFTAQLQTARIVKAL